MAEFKNVRVDMHDGVGRLTLNRPPLNVLNIEMMNEISAAIEGMAREMALKVVVIQATGKAFSAGVDVAEHTADRVQDMMAAFGRMFKVLNRMEIPTVALVQGAALGGGCELAVFCDMILASERAKFGQPEIQVGVFPPVAVPIFPRLVGRNRALELMLTGDIITAADAEKIGLVNHVYPLDSFAEDANGFITKLAGLSAPVLRLTKKAVDTCMYLPVMEGMEEADRIYLDELMKTEDAHEGLTAFMEKRKPQWRNR